MPQQIYIYWSRDLIMRKTCYWIIRYVCALHFSVPSESLLLSQIPVIIHQSLGAPLHMALFLLRSTHMGTYLWAPSCSSIMGGKGCCARRVCCAKIVGGMDLNRWGYAGVYETILMREIYCVKPNPKTDSQSGSQVRKRLGPDLRRASGSTTFQP